MITLCVRGKKGYSVLTATDKKMVSNVIYDTDKGVDNDYSDAIVTYCMDNNINIALGYSTYVIAAGWDKIIEHERVIVFHDSLLPKYRGFCPLPAMLINGETTIGVTAFRGTSAYDEGPIINQMYRNISYPIKINEAIEIICELYHVMTSYVIDNIYNLPSIGQRSEPSYSPWRDDIDYRINWNWSAEKIKRFVDAVGPPYAGAYTSVNGKKIRIYDCEVVDDVIVEDRQSHIGKTIFKDTVICGEGLLKIKGDKFKIRYE